MKRLIPAALILVFIILLCVSANLLINDICDDTLEDINRFHNKTITAQFLQKIWKTNKEKLSLFVNHGFLDEISVYIGQLTVSDADIKSPEFETIYKNIQTILLIIKEEQHLAPHSFY